jgi:hypothetical protein
MDRSVLLNNTGAQQLRAKNYVAALELFRAALEAKLHRERNEEDSMQFERCVTPDPESSDPDELSACNPQHPNLCIPRKISGIDLIPEEFFALTDEIALSPFETISQISALRDEDDALNRSNNHIEPPCFLYTQPFELSLRSDPLSRASIACIIFNIAILHHMQSRQSRKAAAFYDLAASLLSQEVNSPCAALLRLAILNNFFVWTCTNSTESSSQLCLYHLSSTLGECSATLPENIRNGVEANLLAVHAPKMPAGSYWARG